MKRLVARWWPAAALMLAMTACGGGQSRYSDDPAAARIQALTDFCLGYGVMLDITTPFVRVDVERTEPKLSQSMVEGYATAIDVISPFCLSTFDPTITTFDLTDLSKQLQAVRLVLLKAQEGA